MKEKFKEILERHTGIYPAPVISIAQDLGYDVMLFDPKKKETQNISGYINYKEKKIYVNSEDAPTRRQFTIAHEIGHIINEDDIGNEDHVDYRSTIDSPKAEKEIKANKFAANLLMPEDDFKHEWKKLQSLEFSKSSIADRLSIYFAVSKQALEIRAKDLKLI